MMIYLRHHRLLSLTCFSLHCHRQPPCKFNIECDGRYLPVTPVNQIRMQPGMKSYATDIIGILARKNMLALNMHSNLLSSTESFFVK